MNWFDGDDGWMGDCRLPRLFGRFGGPCGKPRAAEVIRFEAGLHLFIFSSPPHQKHSIHNMGAVEVLQVPVLPYPHHLQDFERFCCNRVRLIAIVGRFKDGDAEPSSNYDELMHGISLNTVNS